MIFSEKIKSLFKKFLIFCAIVCFCCTSCAEDLENSPFGVNFWRKELDNSHIGWVRINITWDDVEKEKGKFVFDKIDKYINGLLKSNLHILAVLRFPPSWARRVPDGYRAPDTGAHKGWGDFPPNDLNAWGRYVFETVLHFKDRIKYWEIWNEPNIELFFNGGTVEDYVALLKVAYLNAKKADPECKIIGLGGADAIYAKMVFERGGFDFMDIASVHIYNFLGQMPERGYIPYITDTKGVISEYGEKDIWVTETGWPTHYGMADGWVGVSLYEQANYLVRSIVLLLSEDVKKIFWFMSHDAGEDNTNFEHNQGLLYYNGMPKPSYFAYTNLIKMIDGFLSVEKLNISPFYIYLFRKDGMSCFVLWSISKRAKLEIQDEITDIFDINGRKIEMSETFLPISSSPVYILTEDPEKIKSILKNAKIILK